MTSDPALNVAVVGAGTLGSTVAHCALLAGSEVRLLVRGGPSRERVRAEQIRRSLRHDAARGRITSDLAAAGAARLHTTGDLAELKDADVVVESVAEDLALKWHVIDLIEAHVGPGALIASTTSSLPAGWLARQAQHPERIVVAHYVWPAHRIPIVEVAVHRRFSPAAGRTLNALLAGQAKTAVRVADRPGFLITRALFAYWDATCELLLRDGVHPVAVDAALERFGWPMGPVRVMDAVGLASLAHVHAALTEHLRGLFPSLGELCRRAERIAASRDALVDPVMVADILAAHPDPATARGVMTDSDIVGRTVGALAAEVDRAVAEGVVGSWDEGGAAVDLAYGFPRRHVSLQHWWYSQTTRLAERPLSIARH